MNPCHITMDSAVPVISEDGSFTLESKQFGVTYHSRYGALEESITVFLSAGLQYLLLNEQKDIKILEMGFGTGLNAFITFLESSNKNYTVHYCGIEKFPISTELAFSLNYPTLLNSPQHKDAFERMHLADASSISISQNFSFEKHELDLFDFKSNEYFNLVYYDAFAPTSQPELWTEEALNHVASLMETDGVLVTYCAKGSFKRALKAAGFRVEALPGPRGKREMTRAFKL